APPVSPHAHPWLVAPTAPITPSTIAPPRAAAPRGRAARARRARSTIAPSAPSDAIHASGDGVLAPGVEQPHDEPLAPSDGSGRPRINGWLTLPTFPSSSFTSTSTDSAPPTSRAATSASGAHCDHVPSFPLESVVR